MPEKEPTGLRVDVEVLKSQMGTLTNLCEKMDKVIEKLVDHQGVLINQIYADMDKRKDDLNEDIKDVYARLSAMDASILDKMEKSEERISKKLEELSTKIQEHTDSEERVVAVFAKYKWLIVAAVIVISWLTSHVGPDTILKVLGSIIK